MSFDGVKLKPGDHMAIDPGNIGSGWVIWREDSEAISGITIRHHGRDRNVDIRKFMARHSNFTGACHLEIETSQPRGQAVSGEMMQTLIQIGRILQMWRGKWSYVFREKVKHVICGNPGVKDTNVRAALLDYFGGEATAIGGKKCSKCKGNKTVGRAECPKCKKTAQKDNDCTHCNGGKDKSVYRKRRCPQCRGRGLQTPKGPLHGIAEHEWAALAVAVYWLEVGEEDVHQVSKQQNIAKQHKKWDRRAKTSKGVPA